MIGEKSTHIIVWAIHKSIMTERTLKPIILLLLILCLKCVTQGAHAV